MTDSDHAPDRGVPDGAAPAQPPRRPTDTTDDLTTDTGNTPAALSQEHEPDGPAATDPDLIDDAANLGVDSPDPGDAVPGDGTVDDGPEHGEEDALRTAVHGREWSAARADTADDTPTPTETPAG